MAHFSPSDETCAAFPDSLRLSTILPQMVQKYFLPEPQMEFNMIRHEADPRSAPLSPFNFRTQPFTVNFVD